MAPYYLPFLNSSATTRVMSLNPYWLVLWVLSRQSIRCENLQHISDWKSVISTRRNVSSGRFGCAGLASNCRLYVRTGDGISFCSSATIRSVDTASSACLWEEKSLTLRVMFTQSCRVIKCFLLASCVNCLLASLVPTSDLMSAKASNQKVVRTC